MAIYLWAARHSNQSAFGRQPQPMRVLVRHRILMLNVLVRALLQHFARRTPERNTFK
jgi:hypothetical protein